jgi:RNA polymerase sigma-70 factor (ECF subfamily)
MDSKQKGGRWAHMTFERSELMKSVEPLRRFAKKLCQNDSDAEDLLQSTILQAIEKEHLYQSGTNLFSWMSKIMYNKFVSQYRRRAKFETQFDPQDLINRQARAPDQEDQAELDLIEEAMSQLADEHRDILVMICIQDMQYHEAAEKLGIPVGTVRSRLSRAREALRRELGNGYIQMDDLRQRERKRQLQGVDAA